MEKDNVRAPDEVLVVAAILGDLDAFDELVVRYRGAVLRVARSIAGSDAEDIAQDSWLLAFKSLPSIDDPQKFAAWLMMITRHRALRYRESEKKRKARQLPIDTFLLERIRALQTREGVFREEEEHVQKALDLIPEHFSLVMRMRYYDGMSIRQIAAFLDLTESNVKWRIFKGKSLLLEQIRLLEGTI